MDPGEAAATAAVAHRLRRRFPQLTADEIDAAVQEAERTYDGRPIRSFVPILVERDVIERFSPGSALAPRQPSGSEPSVPA
jgi:hypothetical protein